MNTPPRWFKPVVVLALVWNLMGCAAQVSDALMTADDIAKLSADQQALYAARPAWAMVAMAAAVWGGTLGCVGLLLRKSWAVPLFWISLIGLIFQDIGLFGMTDILKTAGPVPVVLQSLVLLVAVALLRLGNRSKTEGWIA